MKKIIKKASAILICMVVGLIFMSVSAYATESKKLICIVYDDTSGIYYGEKGEFTDKWSRMKNAVSVFCSLTNDGDKVIVYPISGDGEKYEFTNDDNANTIATQVDEKLNGYALHRSFKVVENAFDDLKNANNSYEKWLVVMCDGKFEEYKDENSDSSVQEKLSSYAKDGVKVVSQSVSNDGAIYNLKNDENFYCYNANDSKEILQKTIDISNLIYQRANLGDEYIDYNKKNGILEISDTGIPMSELIIITSGANSYSSAQFSSESRQTQVFVKSPKSVPEIFTGSPDKIKSASDLEKSIFINRFNQLLQPEKITINISRGEDVKVIYKASIQVEFWLYSNGNRVDSNSGISTGKYDYRAVALNPTTRNQITSSLLDGAVYSIHAENMGNATNLDKREGEISFLKGNTRIETTLEFGSAHFSSSKVFYVFGDADFTINKTSKFNVKNFIDAKPICITVATESLFENISLFCTSDENISFRCEKNDKTGEFYIYPEYKNNGSYLFAPTGTVDVLITVEINENGEVMTFSKPESIYIENVDFRTRLADGIWYYKWCIAITFAAVVLFLILFMKFASKKKDIGLQDDEIITKENEI